MEKIIAILTVAANVLEKAASLVRAFLVKNTPESALLGALVAVYQGWSTGNMPTSAAVLMVFGALMTFAVAESAKDARAAQP